MALKLKIVRTTEFVEYREDNDNLESEVLASFEVQPLTPSESIKLLKKHQKNEFIVKPGGRGKNKDYERVQDPDFAALMHDKVDQVIKGWKGVVSEDGTEIPCTKENKIQVYELNPDVINFVLDKAENFGKAVEEAEDEEIKN